MIKELLYKNMVAAKADWLYELPQWKEIFSEEERKNFTKSRRNPVQYARAKKWDETILAHAEAERSIKSAAEDRK